MIGNITQKREITVANSVINFGGIELAEGFNNSLR